MRCLAPAWWYAPSWISSALLPASWLYRLGRWIHCRFSRPWKASIPTFCVGNIVVGGAGKTPVCLAIAQGLTARGIRCAVVTKHYQGRDRRTRLVDLAYDRFPQVGDEALLLARTLPTIITGSRRKAIRYAASLGFECVLCDDGMQDPSMAYHRIIAVSSGPQELGNGRLLPAGPLREPSIGLARADYLVMLGSGSPPTHPHPPLCHATRTLPPPVHPEARYVAFAGIAHPSRFFSLLTDAGYLVVDRQGFPDHHGYSDQDIATLRATAEKHQARLITTEKDWVRLSPLLQLEIGFIPMGLTWHADEGLYRCLLESLRKTDEAG